MKIEGYSMFSEEATEQLPTVDGAIDCTHVRLVSTQFQNIDEVYRNRKGYLSLNVQVDIPFFSFHEITFFLSQ